MRGAVEVKWSVRQHYSRVVVQEVGTLIFTPSVTEGEFEAGVPECTDSSMVDAEVEGIVLL